MYGGGFDRVDGVSDGGVDAGQFSVPINSPSRRMNRRKQGLLPGQESKFNQLLSVEKGQPVVARVRLCGR